MKRKWMGMILLISILLMSCGVQNPVETENGSGMEPQEKSIKEGMPNEVKTKTSMEEVGRYSSPTKAAVGDDGEFYFVEVQNDSCTVHIFNSEEQQIGTVTLKTGYDLFGVEVKQGRVLLFTYNNDYEKALLYHYVMETNVVEEYAIPWHEEYIVYKDSIYFSTEAENDPMIIKTNFKGEVEKKIQLVEDLFDFSMKLIYQDRIYIQDLIGARSIIDDGVVYSMNLDGSDWKEIDLGKKFKGKYGYSFDASGGYIYMTISTDIVGDPCSLYRFAIDGNELELVAQSEKIDEFAIGKDAIFYITNDNYTTIYSVNRKTGEEQEFKQIEIDDAKRMANALMVSEDSLIIQTVEYDNFDFANLMKVGNEEFIVVPQE